MTEFSDGMFDGLEELLRETARSSNRSDADFATRTRADLVVELNQVARVLAGHCRQVLTDGGGNWLAVGLMLHAAARSCLNEAVIDGD